jgi:hypothetical protein
VFSNLFLRRILFSCLDHLLSASASGATELPDACRILRGWPDSVAESPTIPLLPGFQFNYGIAGYPLPNSLALPRGWNCTLNCIAWSEHMKQQLGHAYKSR